MVDARFESSDVPQAKKALRAEILRRLREQSEHGQLQGSRALSARLMSLDEIREAGTVMFFMAMRTEIDPRAAMAACLAEGIRVAVPRVDEASRELEAVAIESLDERFFERDRFGIPTPRSGKAVKATELDVIVVPGLAFDRRGGRLGRGAGYYDRLLVRVTDRCATVGIGFDFQVVDAVPCEPHDRRVQRIATNDELIEVE